MHYKIIILINIEDKSRKVVIKSNEKEHKAEIENDKEQKKVITQISEPDVKIYL